MEIEISNQINKEFKDLSVDELAKGYTHSLKDNTYTCIFCGKTFEEGVIYPVGPRLLMAEKAVKEHLNLEHGCVFASLISMNKQVNGLTDIQKNILKLFYEKKDTDKISEEMDITPATVRTHRYNIQKMKREAKILLALMELLEDEERQEFKLVKNKIDADKNEDEVLVDVIPTSFSGNTLHPFFTQRKLY